MKLSLFLVFSCLAFFSIGQQQENTPKVKEKTDQPNKKVHYEQISNSKKIEKRIARPKAVSEGKKEEEKISNQ